MPTYLELLKDPRWQRKRLEVLNAANWRCLCCLDSETTLHVHHRWYERGRKPWEYGLDCLVSLCEKCHEEATRDQEEAKVALRTIPEERLRVVIGILRALGVYEDDSDRTIQIDDYNDAVGVGFVLNRHPDDVVGLATSSKGAVRMGDIIALKPRRR